MVESYRPGRTEAEIMAPAVERFFARGAGPRMMNIVLSGAHGEAEAYFMVRKATGWSSPERSSRAGRARGQKR